MQQPQYLTNIGIADADLVPNFALILDSTNQSIRNDSPADVLRRADIVRTAVESHRIDVTTMEANDWNRFLRARAGSLKNAMNEAVA